MTWYQADGRIKNRKSVLGGNKMTPLPAEEPMTDLVAELNEKLKAFNREMNEIEAIRRKGLMMPPEPEENHICHDFNEKERTPTMEDQIAKLAEEMAKRAQDRTDLAFAMEVLGGALAILRVHVSEKENPFLSLCQTLHDIVHAVSCDLRFIAGRMDDLEHRDVAEALLDTWRGKKVELIFVGTRSSGIDTWWNNGGRELWEEVGSKEAYPPCATLQQDEADRWMARAKKIRGWDGDYQNCPPVRVSVR